MAVARDETGAESLCYWACSPDETCDRGDDSGVPDSTAVSLFVS